MYHLLKLAYQFSSYAQDNLQSSNQRRKILLNKYSTPYPQKPLGIYHEETTKCKKVSISCDINSLVIKEIRCIDFPPAQVSSSLNINVVNFSVEFHVLRRYVMLQTSAQFTT